VLLQFFPRAFKRTELLLAAAVLLTCIQEMFGLVLSHLPDILVDDYRDVSGCLKANAEVVIAYRARPLPSRSLPRTELANMRTPRKVLAALGQLNSSNNTLSL
jgi:hypothetical protein